ncbi:ribosome-associated translation inhibitor RaiA [Allofranklinella schreckenbergeri]|uniref:Ribosome hibernation promoting factor n=1 Tax=Allofranklinella schreckenbergeri TaxID=1076744 RepID=A0A3M6R5Q4_9BURK|nr:ribosome-associated translation inhibitor RaiA [Allofranklinella schreckenbergeri]RMW98572.1 ribosome-associated translation inhibitor RaiA [Allofranklinella schreckenbergeri]RMW98789.1 ribosome-associated translation inhibitor RaiA [Allofranklinella schreckenbergeri]RMX10573.1 ribosome-associated translation inhibitor RaiA [Allofranklinella schreckenbergeri]RRD41567.1 ribosome-associated translation inhibitor RaiA [Comamonadaceae bacterium OH3737_COT-264]
MNLTISGHHLEVTPALKEFVSNKLARVTKRFDQVIDVRVLLSLENTKEKEGRQSAECTMLLKGGDIHVKTSHEDLYAAIDEMVDKLDRQIVKFKDKIKDHDHQAHKKTLSA